MKYPKHKTSGLILLVSFCAMSIAIEDSSSPTETGIDQISAACRDHKNYSCIPGLVDGKPCLIAYCISDEHASNPVAWFYHCPEKST